MNLEYLVTMATWNTLVSTDLEFMENLHKELTWTVTEGEIMHIFSD